MPGSSERNQTKRRRRAAAALGITLVVAGGLAYAATRDGSPSGDPSSSAAPPPADAPTPSAGAPSDAPSDTDTDTSTTSPDPETTNPDPGTKPGTPAPPAGSDDPGTPTADPPAAPTPPAPSGEDINLEPASRGPGDPGTNPETEPDPGTEEANFAVSGNPAGFFRPGRSQSLDLTITNPNGSDLTVTALTVTVGPSSVPACGPENLVVTQQFSGSFVVPAHATRSLSALNVPVGQWPVLTMPDRPVNQDACQQATFQLTYTGTGTVQS